jgi:hypothetical protein
MNDLIEAMAKTACEQKLWVGAFEQETEGNQEFWRDVAHAQLAAIEAAGYAVVPRDPTSEMLHAAQATNNQYTPDKWKAMIAAVRSYADLADGATTFDPEAKDNGL